MPWAKGQSGNPKGRKAEADPVKKFARERSVEAIKRLAELVKSEDGNVAIKASNAILDRAYGKPAQAVTGEDGGPLRLVIETGVPQPDGEG